MSLPHAVDAPITCPDWDEVVDSLEWQDYSYICYKEGANYYAKNGETMVIEYSGADASTVVQSAIDDIPSSGLIFLKAGTYEDFHVVVEEKAIYFMGEGIGTTVEPPADEYAFTFQSDGVDNYDIPGGVYNLRIETDEANSSGIKFYDAAYGEVDRVWIYATLHGVYIGGDQANSSYNTRVTNSTIRMGGTAGSYGVLVQPTGVVCADVKLINVMVHEADYCYYFAEGANGPQLTDCGATGADQAAFTFAGSYSGGWVESCWADLCAGNGFVITDGDTWYSHAIQFSKIWASGCEIGMLIDGNVNGVFEIMVQGIFFVNRSTGIWIEGDVKYTQIHDSIIRGNNSDDVAGMRSTNLLIYNDPHWIDISNCEMGWPYIAGLKPNREYAMRIYMDNSATRHTLVRISDCIFTDDADSSHAMVGLYNTSVTEVLTVHVDANLSVDEAPIGHVLEVEAGSTGTITQYDMSTWANTYDSLDPVGATEEGQIVNLRTDGTHPSIAYIAAENIGGGYEWVPLGMSDDVLVVFDDLAPAIEGEAGATVAADAWLNYLGNNYFNLQYGGNDRIEIGNTEVIIQNVPLQMDNQKVQFGTDDAESVRSDDTDLIFEVNSSDELQLSPTALYPSIAGGLDLGDADHEFEDLYIGTGRVWLYTDQNESIRSSGADIIWTVGGNDELKLGPAALYPNVSMGLDLGTVDQEFNDEYLAGKLYFFTDQAEYVYSDGNDLIFGVAGGDVMTLDAGQLLAGGVNLGAVGTQWGDAYIDGTAYIDGLTIEASLDVDAIDVNATGVGSVTAVVPVTSEGGTNYIALYDGYS